MQFKFLQVTGFFLLVLFLAKMLLLPSCATIVPPEGGPRDSLPPVLLKAAPADSTFNFSGNKIVLTFNEYIGDVNDYYQNLIVSPLPQNMPLVTRKLETVTIKLRDTLEANTTYTLDFGNTLKDVNEGNVFKNFKYTFSTGTYFDSLSFGGRVILAETGETDSTLTIMLHRSNEDSAVANEKPRFIARTNREGRFSFKNLPPGTFYIYALKDQGNSYRYLSPAQLFAFADAPVNTAQQNDSVILYAYAAEEEKPMAAAAPTGNDRRNNNKEPNRLQMQTSLASGSQDLLSPLEITFLQPLKNFDSTRVYFSTDSAFNPVTSYHWQLDTLMKTATLTTEWKENTLYHLIFEKDFATDNKGFQLLKKDTLDFNTKKLADYGRLTIRFGNLAKYKNPVLQIVQNNEVKDAYPLEMDIFSKSLFLPGEYNLRILEDLNQNTKWDPGSFFKEKRQPEKVHPVERKINVKPNWDNDFEINL